MSTECAHCVPAKLTTLLSQHKCKRENRERERASTEYIHQLGATVLWLLLTLQLSTSLSPSIHLPSSSLLQECSKLLIHSMPSQMVSRTVEACTTRFQHPSNKPSSQLQMACHAWFLCHRGTATVSAWLECLGAWSMCMCVWVCLFWYVNVSVHACPLSAFFGVCVCFKVKCLSLLGCWFLPVGQIWLLWFNMEFHHK